MSFGLGDAWVGDSWWAYDDVEQRHHLFFLHAPTSLGDPELRHRRARIGHASTVDLHRWTRHPDPLPTPMAGFDDLASWTGCTVKGLGSWWLFTTGLTRDDDGCIQRIGA